MKKSIYLLFALCPLNFALAQQGTIQLPTAGTLPDKAVELSF